MTERRILSRALGYLEGLVLIAVAAYAGCLALFGEYWMLLNPGFKWLTLSTAVALFIAGGTALWRPVRSANGFGVAVFLVFIVIAASGSARVFDLSPPEEISSRLRTPEPSRIEFEGQEYIRINLAELLLLSSKPGQAGEHPYFTLFGQVRRTGNTGTAGVFYLVRVMVWCCLADATGVGLMVDGGEGDAFKDGEWVRVHARLKPLGAQNRERLELDQKDFPLLMLSDTFLLKPVFIERIDEPEIPYIFTINTQEPYSY